MRARLSFARMRTLHLYLGSFFTPLLLFFLVSGAWQTFAMHRSTKDGRYTAPPALAKLSDVHMLQRFPQGGTYPKPSAPFRVLVVVMSIGLAASTALGLVMALKLARPLWVWATLAAGALLPALLLYAECARLSP